MTEYLTHSEIMEMHKVLLDRYGGLHGVRNEGGLESALNRPQTGYYNDIIEEAAALWESLSQNHPFVDGNKRVAFAAVYTFLAVNGIKLKSTPSETFAFIDGMLSTQRFEFKELNEWLTNNTDKS